MKTTTNTFGRRLQLGLATGALTVVLASLVLTGFGQAKEEVKNPPAHFQLDDTPIKRGDAVGNSYSPIVKRISPSVVNVFTTTKPKRIEGQYMPFLDDPFFRRFFGDSFDGQGREYRTPKQHGLGSGVIVTEDGYILTNNHVVDGADEIKVALKSGNGEYDARVVGKDPQSDIAVLKIEAKDLPVAQLGNSEDIEVGDVVLAIGNPFGIGKTVTMGIVSAMGRATLGLDYEDFIQTDAAINPGNSGGALVDVEGRLIGINTAILSRSGGNQGIGFAIPINLARSVMESLIREGRVIRGFLGVTIQNVTPDLAQAFDLKEAKGALISEVMPDSPAKKAGLESGDVVLEFDGKEVKDSRHLKLTVAQAAPGSKVTVKILRDGKTKEIEVVLKELPRSGLAAGGSTPEGDASQEGLKGVGVTDLDSRSRSQFNLPEHVEGALVTQVEPDSAAYEAGLREGDVIQEINRKPVRNAEDAVRLTQNMKSKTILLRIWSKGGSRFLVVDES